MLYTNNTHGSYSAGFIYYIRSIQGRLAAHWPHVERPTRLDWQTFLSVCLDFPYYWEQGGFLSTVFFFVCVCAGLSGDDRRVGCDTVADFSITRPGDWQTWNSFDTSQAQHFAKAKGRVEISGSRALVYTTGLLHCTKSVGYHSKDNHPPFKRQRAIF